MPISDATKAGQSVYSPLVLRIYDLYVLGFSNRFIWSCPTSALRELYNRNVSAKHIDIGVGTGYFLDRAKWPVSSPSITLVDLNANSLNAASRRVRRYAPETIHANALEPLPVRGPFNSAALCYLLHCMPGTIPDKAALFDHLGPHLEQGARIFGATILQGSVPRTGRAQRLMNIYNKEGIFSNAGDAIEDLEVELKKRFTNVRIGVKGVVALFEAVAG
ncbi:MAG: class I SAM-dependent methyltransferase [Hyphomicrobiales bacterium]|nr:class I SAM-dependent methyltransferase [Hyphomicrobiales bacterium]